MLGREAADVDPVAMTRVEYLDQRERADRLAQRPGRDAELDGQIEEAGQAIAGIELAVDNHRLDDLNCAISRRHPAAKHRTYSATLRWASMNHKPLIRGIYSSQSFTITRSSTVVSTKLRQCAQ